MQIIRKTQSRSPRRAAGAVRRRAGALSVMVLAPLLWAASCGSAIHFLNPLFDKPDLVADARLEGEWVRADTSRGDHWAVRYDSSSNDYLVAIAPEALARGVLRIDPSFADSDSATRRRLRSDPAARARRARDSSLFARLTDDSAGPRLFEARLGRLGGALMVDIVASGWREAQRLPNLRLDTHALWRVDVRGTELHLVPLSGRWLRTMLDSSRIELGHSPIRSSDGTLVTASTAELQRALLPFVQDTAAFAERSAIVLRRPAPARATTRPPARKP